MDIDRPHFRTTSSGSSTAATTTTGELFICFTSRLSSSSSMKLSKSILSPARAARDGAPTTLSSSLSRRLRTNGSIKGGASPFFTTSGKKRGCAFDNPEPSSPKVTCIGQVRVKTKKKVKQTRSLSKRRSAPAGGGEVSFRKIEHSSTDADDKASAQHQQQQRCSNASGHYPPPQECQTHRNQKWVHLPVSICEAVRTFGAEFSCLFPCKSSCFSSEREKSEKQSGSDENGCGAVFARWLVAVNDGEGGKRREIELVVGGGDEEEEEEEERRVSMRSSRRHVFDDIEVKDLEREDERGARVSICVPPKNALLLMRCRSDPMKMAALTSKNLDQHIQEEEDNVVDDGKDQTFQQKLAETAEEKEKINEDEEKLEEMEGDGEEKLEEEDLEIRTAKMVEEIIELEMLALDGDGEASVVEEGGHGGGEEEEREEVESNMSSFEDLLEQENAEQYEDCCPIQDDEHVKDEENHLSVSPSSESDEEGCVQTNEEDETAAAAAVSMSLEELDLLNNEEENKTTTPPPETTAAEEEEDEQGEREKREEEDEQEERGKREEEERKEAKPEREAKKERERPLLPECLLLMMCEPKLSMEVSKETWVCSTDFTRWLPERPRRAAKAAKPVTGGGDNEFVKRRLSIDSKAKPITEKSEVHQPPRSSCSLPVAAASMASMIEQKLVNAVAYEPFVLTRCKSEPMKTAAAKLIPESCFWKNTVSKMEPHRCAAMGVGAAGVGF